MYTLVVFSASRRSCRRGGEPVRATHFAARLARRRHRDFPMTMPVEQEARYAATFYQFDPSFSKGETFDVRFPGWWVDSSSGSLRKQSTTPLESRFCARKQLRSSSRGRRINIGQVAPGLAEPPATLAFNCSGKVRFSAGLAAAPGTPPQAASLTTRHLHWGRTQNPPKSRSVCQYTGASELAHSLN